jgi:hypothetical protein
MKKIFCSFLMTLFIFAGPISHKAHAEIPVKAKAFLTMAGYGAAGGALLGLASMAFGNSSRAVAQGASIGLYAGIIFGTYVLVSHHQKQAGNYDDNSSPYQQSSDIYGDDYGSGEGGGSDAGAPKKGGFFDRIQILREQVENQAFTFDSQKRKNQLPPVHLNVINFQF